MRSGVRLGIDPGDARIGVAACDRSGLIATPLETVARGEGDLARLAALIAEHDPIEIVVGLPVSMNGTEGLAAAKVRQFAGELAAVVPVVVRLVDERLTTVSAHAALQQAGRRSKNRRSVVDQVAAVVLLQHALDTERASGRAPGEVLSATQEGLS